MYALKVHKKEAQKKIKELKKEELFDRSREIVRDGDFVYIPVKEKIKGVVEKDLPKKERIPSLKETYGISSFDIIGDVAVVFIPDNLWDKRNEIGEHLMKLYPRLKGVYAEVGATYGKFRIKPLELIAGVGGETIHRENGLMFKLDITKVYFSPRQANERMKILRYVNRDDVVAVFFAGIGPIPIYISKFTKAKKIFAIEINPEACKYMKENVKLNKCENIEIICGDVRQVYSQLPKCDLVIMPLPKGSLFFLNEASAVLKTGGRVIIYVASRENELEEKLRAIKNYFEIKEIRKELEIGPREYRFVILGEKSSSLSGEHEQNGEREVTAKPCKE